MATEVKPIRSDADNEAAALAEIDRLSEAKPASAGPLPLGEGPKGRGDRIGMIGGCTSGSRSPLRS
jgi:hypothetical protein